MALDRTKKSSHATAAPDAHETGAQKTAALDKSGQAAITRMMSDSEKDSRYASPDDYQQMAQKLIGECPWGHEWAERYGCLKDIQDAIAIALALWQYDNGRVSKLEACATLFDDLNRLAGGQPGSNQKVGGRGRGPFHQPGRRVARLLRDARPRQIRAQSDQGRAGVTTSCAASSRRRTPRQPTAAAPNRKSSASAVAA